METHNSPHVEKRAHNRYIVSGIAKITLGGDTAVGRVVSVGGGGVLIYCDVTSEVDNEVALEFSVAGHDIGRLISSRGRVAWTQPGKLGIEFLEKPAGLTDLLVWLERSGSGSSKTE